MVKYFSPISIVIKLGSKVYDELKCLLDCEHSDVTMS